MRSKAPTPEIPVLVVWTDGMDQAKWCIPRFPNLRAAKRLGSFQRPRCKVQGVWLFHVGLYFYVADATMPHDAAFTVECIARALERMKAACASRSLPVPTELIIWVAGLLQSLFVRVVLVSLTPIAPRSPSCKVL